MKEIPLTKGYIAQVDDEQFDKLIKLKWHAQVHKHTVYAASITKDEKGKRVYFLMHRVILGVTSSRVYVDHKDGNGLNNQGFNIRPCTSSQNAMNSKGNLASSSRLKGVSWNIGLKIWVANIMIDGKIKSLGVFENEEDAARVYNQLAKEHHKEFARLNDVHPMFPETEWRPVVITPRNKSGFRGVSINKRDGNWVAHIGIKGKSKHLGYFYTAIEAAKAYDAKAIEIHGSNARLNFQK